MSKSHYIIPIFVPHLGCPHNCVFCNQNSITGAKDNIDYKYVINTVNTYLSTLPKSNVVIEISFFGGTFTAIDIDLQKELLSAAKYFKSNKKVQFIRLSTRPDYINEEILLNLKSYDVDIIELGVQSLDQEVLLLSGRGHNIDDTYKASSLIRKYGFVLGHQIMLGLPGDNFNKDIDTVKQIIRLKPDICRIYPALVIKNTPMEQMYFNHKYKPYTLKEAIYISKIIYAMLVSNNINVIRIGLQPTNEININREIIDGPFHPAFRELVEGSLLIDMISEKIENIMSEEVNILINSKDISKLYCNKKEFFNDMISNYKTKCFKVIQDNNIKNGGIKLMCGNSLINMSFNEYFQKLYLEGNY